jgi:acetyl-CoA carboxylase/biotin carboxylase 1
MYDEVLKLGYKIVDGLSSYKRPVFIHIVANGVRGGAWVVLRPSINPEQMDLYADVDACAGVLEPEGIVEIKMRCDKIQVLMESLDLAYASLTQDNKDNAKTADQCGAAASF